MKSGDERGLERSLKEERSGDLASVELGGLTRLVRARQPSVAVLRELERTQHKLSKLGLEESEESRHTAVLKGVWAPYRGAWGLAK